MNAALTIWTFSEYLLRCLLFFWQTNNRTEWDVNKSAVCTHPVSPEKRSSWVIKDTCVVDCGHIGSAYKWLVLHSHCGVGGGGEQCKTKTEFSECSVSKMIQTIPSRSLLVLIQSDFVPLLCAPSWFTSSNQILWLYHLSTSQSLMPILLISSIACTSAAPDTYVNQLFLIRENSYKA